MFNTSAVNHSGYNGMSQIHEDRCSSPYHANETDRSNSSMYADTNKMPKVVSMPGNRKILQARRQSDGHQLDDVYTFKDSDIQYSHNIHSTPRLSNSLNRKSDELDKYTDSFSSSPSSSPRSIKQMNGYSSSSSNGLHDVKSVKQHSVSSNPFSNLAMGGDQRKLTDNSVNMNDTKNSISRLSMECKVKVKSEPVEVKSEPAWSMEGRVSAPLFSTPYKLPTTTPPRKLSTGKQVTSSPRCRRGRGPALHEALQRITPLGLPSGGKGVPWTSPATPLFDCSPLDANHKDDAYNSYIQPWLEGVSGCEPTLGRAERLAARRATLRRRTTQLTRYTHTLHTSYTLYHIVKSQLDKVCNSERNELSQIPPPTLDKLLTSRGYTTLLSATDRKKIRSSGKLLGGGTCIVEGCTSAAMACAVYCSRHIASCGEQTLFASCTAKFSDNTQCKMPVINITNHLPLCDEHAWKRDNYNKISQEVKPKKAPRKRAKPSAMIRPQKRNRKRKKAPPPPAIQVDNTPTISSTQGSTSSGCEESTEEAPIAFTEEFIETTTNHHIDEEVVAQVLGLQVEEVRAPSPSQDGNIDLSAVINDFFTAEQNEEYVPTREETEELERALEAVNRDVKSLEKFLDDKTLAETLASFPDVFSPSPNCTA